MRFERAFTDAPSRIEFAGFYENTNNNIIYLCLWKLENLILRDRFEICPLREPFSTSVSAAPAVGKADNMRPGLF
jgi:hypothetical protein